MAVTTMAVARPPVSWVLGVLDRETASHHATAEADLFRVLDDVTIEGYHRFLERVFHFEYAVEVELAGAGLPDRFLAPRLKTHRLADDLLALGRPRGIDPRVALSLDLPRLRDPVDALAWLYVLQRNTLHHLPLYRALAPRLRSPLKLASRYLTTHTADVYQRWHELGAVLDRAVTPEQHEHVIVVARAAFRLQHIWYDAG
jgi:heme oxygenase